MARRTKSPYRRSGRSSSLWSLVLLLVGLSAYQYYEQGRITWPETLYAEARDLLAEAGGAQRQSTTSAQQPESPFPEASAPGSPNTNQVPDAGMSGRVARVTDGDTFRLDSPGVEQQIIRLYGVDAPERDQPYGSEASRALASRIDGRQVTVTVEDVDQYGRLVGTVYVDGANVNLALIEEGAAWWYEYYAEDERALELAEQAAREQRRGLWAARDPVAPWDWRRR
jgi:endonuclease YncB( thermonuclease family)